MSYHGRPGRGVSSGLVACLTGLVLLALGVSSGGSAAPGTTYTVNSTGDGADANLGNGVCADATDNCTLRAAIQESNEPPADTDRIAFNLPTLPFSIAPTTELPAITDPLEIDGFSQGGPGYAGPPIVELRGPSGPVLNGLRLLTGDSTVRGLVINRFNTQISIASPVAGNRIVGNYIGTDVTGMAAADQSYAGASGIFINGGSDVLIGGSAESDRNVISGNVDGIDTCCGAARITIQGNYIGTDASGEAALAGTPVGGPSHGVFASATETLIVGGDGPSEGNVISGNPLSGVLLRSVSGAEIVGNMIGTDRDGEEAVPNDSGIDADVEMSDVRITRNIISGNDTAVRLSDTERTVIQGNKIGVDVDGLEPIPNGDAMILYVADGLVGGRSPVERNIISGNRGEGIQIYTPGDLETFTRTRVEGNFIGIGADGRPLGNGRTGITEGGGGFGNVIGGTAEGAGNAIAYNGRWGVLVTGCFAGPRPEAVILGNSIHSNGRLGIDLGGVFCPYGEVGPTPNDPDDTDEGANDLQNFPDITAVTSSGGQTVAEVDFNSTPETDFRLEFFRNDSCNATKPPFDVFSGFFGEGQTLVGATQVTTDAAGNWNGNVTLSGETSSTEVITATATHFAEPGVTLAGSTSEFSECLADLAITKSDEPDPVAAGQLLTYTLEVINEGPGPGNEVQVVDTLPSGVTVSSITPSQGTCSLDSFSLTVTCELGLIARDGTAEITIVLDPGSEPREITNAAEVSSELRDPDTTDNSTTETTRVVTGGTIVVRKETLPAGSSQSFEFTTNYGPGFSLSDGQSNTSGPLAAGSYSVGETPVSGWDTSASCSDGSPPSNIDLSSGETVTCTFTNTQRGLVSVRKTVSGAPPSGSESFPFQLRQGSSPTSPGTILESQNASAGNGGLLTFATTLVPATTYALCETVMPGWMTTLGPPFYVVYNPGGDNDTVCTDFSVSPGETKSFAIDNQPPPGGLARTIGFWKNWASCAQSSGGQKPVLDQTLAAAEPAGITIGTLTLHGSTSTPSAAPDCLKAVRLLNKSRIDTGKKMASDPAFNLAAQLLAAKLNVVAGAGTCPAAVTAINAAQTLLDAINFNGVTHATMTSAQKNQANSLATTLDRYNNNLLC